MIDTTELKAQILRKGLTQEKVAIEIGMTPKTFYLKMKKGVFGSDEIYKMLELLDIANPRPIFFAKEVTLKDTE